MSELEIKIKKSKSRYCFVPRCRSGNYRPLKKIKGNPQREHHSLFAAPKDPVLLEKWRAALPTSNKIFDNRSVVCDLHFREEEVLRYLEIKLPNGTVDKLDRGRPSLVPGAVPSIFNTSSKKSEKIKEERESQISDSKNSEQIEQMKAEESQSSDSRSSLENIPPSQNDEIKNDSNDSVESIPPLENNEINDVQVVDTIPESDTTEIIEIHVPTVFEQLKNDFSLISMPTNQWSATYVPEHDDILLAQWYDGYIPKKRIVLHPDMTFEIFFGNAQITLENFSHSISDLKELEKLLRLTHVIKVCQGIKFSSLSDACGGVVKQHIIAKECDHCHDAKVQQRKDDRDIPGLKKRILNFRQRLVEMRYLRRKNIRLKGRIEKLKDCIEIMNKAVMIDINKQIVFNT